MDRKVFFTLHNNRICSNSRMKSHPHIGRKKHPVDARFWEECYRKGDTFWDHGEASPGLVDFLARESYVPGSILVPGCGRGHDCRLLALHGFDVTGVDISPLAVREARKLAAADPGLKRAKGKTKSAASRRIGSLRYVHGDFLARPPRPCGPYDWVFEHTCFCAIDPDLRDRYVQSLVSVLRIGGRFLGVFYNIQPESGPPFGTNAEELSERFSPHFKLLLKTVPRSYPKRQGKELLLLWKKKRERPRIIPAPPT